MVKNFNSYDILVKPIITEKSTNLSANNQVVFEISETATKPLIKAAVEDIFGAKVKRVNTLRLKGKSKRFRGILGKRSDVRKAIVTLEEGNTIDVTAGVK